MPSHDSTDAVVSVSLPESAWRTLLDAVPPSEETYTGSGEGIFAAVQAISHAIESHTDGPAQPTEWQLSLARGVLEPLTASERRAVIAVVAYETMQEAVGDDA